MPAYIAHACLHRGLLRHRCHCLEQGLNILKHSPQGVKLRSLITAMAGLAPGRAAEKGKGPTYSFTRPSSVPFDMLKSPGAEASSAVSLTPGSFTLSRSARRSSWFPTPQLCWWNAAAVCVTLVTFAGPLLAQQHVHASAGHMCAQSSESVAHSCK